MILILCFNYLLITRRSIKLEDAQIYVQKKINIDIIIKFCDYNCCDCHEDYKIFEIIYFWFVEYSKK